MRVDNLGNNSAEFSDLKRRLRQLETATPLANASISRGALTIKSPEGLIVQGSAKVTGTLAVTGTESVTGTLSVAGPLNVTGTTTATGTMNVDGPLIVDGATSLRGATTLTGNMAVTGGGKLTMGSLTISPTAGGGDPGLGSTGTLGINATTIGLNATSIIANGTLSASDIYSSLTGTTSAANVYCSPTTGHFQRVTSAARFKLDIRPMELPDSLLAVPVSDWIDKGAHDRGEPGPRIPGIVAEQVAAAGGEAFVTYDADGVIQGVSYDRLALARTEILARQLEAALARIEQLTARVATAEGSVEATLRGRS